MAKPTTYLHVQNEEEIWYSPLSLSRSLRTLPSTLFLCSTLLARVRRTPLDDAVLGEQWLCARLLMSFGATHTIAMTPEAQGAIEAVSMDNVIEVVKGEKVRARPF